MSVDTNPLASPEARFREIFEQAPISMQLINASGKTLQVNRAWETLWQGTYGDGLKEHVLHGSYNLLTDPQLEAKGITPYLQRACQGESVNIPAILYDPAELGIVARARWVTARAHPIRDARGKVVEVMLMHEDITDRMEAQRTLSISEERFRSLVMATSQMVWSTAGDGIIIEDSPSWRAFTGQSAREWLGTGWLEVIHPDDRARAEAVWRDCVARKCAYQIEYRLRRADGEYRWTSVHGVPLLNADGSVREWIGANTDITEQRQAEQALRVHQERTRFLLDSMHQKIFTTNARGEADYLNPAWSEFTGLPGEQILNWGWLKFIHPDDVDDNILAWQYAVDHGEAYQYEPRFRRHDGQYRWHLTHAVPVRDDAGDVLMWIGSNTDIHEVKTVEAELAQRLDVETRHSALLAKVAAASQTLHTALSMETITGILVDQVREILQVHQAVISLATDQNWTEAITAVSLSDKYRAHAGGWFAPDSGGLHALVCQGNQALRFTQEELLRHPDLQGVLSDAGGRPAWRCWLAVPLIGSDGKNLGLIQASDKYQGDFTEEDEAILTQLAAIAATGFENARLYGSLQEQHRRKDEFLAMLAHELRNPLAPIRAAADLLALGNIGEARLAQTSQIIVRQVRHMTGLIDDLLDVSRVTRGLIELDRVELDVKRIVADAVEQVRPLLESKRHQLKVMLAPEPGRVFGDHKRLVQILANILNNAAKYTPDGGVIRVAAEAAGDEVVLSVIDNGIGIAPQLQAHVFELFAQAERSSDRSQGGLGIGLALVKSLVELHGGQVACESAGIGHGSRFIVRLPAIRQQKPRLQDEGAAARQIDAARSLRIMVVDDNVDAARMLAMYLDMAGHQVCVEHRADEALLRAASFNPAVCILDIGLPDMDGKMLASRLRQSAQSAGALLIALTGYGREEDKESALAAGFDHHLVKPVDAQRIIALLEQKTAA